MRNTLFFRGNGFYFLLCEHSLACFVKTPLYPFILDAFSIVFSYLTCLLERRYNPPIVSMNAFENLLIVYSSHSETMCRGRPNRLAGQPNIHRETKCGALQGSCRMGRGVWIGRWWSGGRGGRSLPTPPVCPNQYAPPMLDLRAVFQSTAKSLAENLLPPKIWRKMCCRQVFGGNKCSAKYLAPPKIWRRQIFSFKNVTF